MVRQTRNYSRKSAKWAVAAAVAVALPAMTAIANAQPFSSLEAAGAKRVRPDCHSKLPQ